MTDFAAVSDGNHMGVSDKFVEDSDGIPYYRGSDIYNLFIEKAADPMRIDRATFQSPQMARSHLKKGDVLMSIVGAIIGNVSLVSENFEASCSCKLAILRPQAIRAELLSVFLSSNFGQVQIQKFKRGAAQTGLILEDFDQIQVPSFTKLFEKKIVETVNAAYVATLAAESAMDLAAKDLLSDLGIENWCSSEPLSYVGSSSVAFAAERFDAEYFYPVKISALATLDALSDCTLADLFESVRTLWQPADAPVGVPVRNYDLTDALIPFLNGAKKTSEPEEIASTKKLVQAGDLVVSRLRSYLKEIAIVQASDGGVPMVASTEYIVLRPKPGTALSVEALMIYLRSQLPQLVFKWSQDGSNHPRFDERELLRLPVPRLLITQSDKYVSTVQSMIASRKQATRLLEAAKRAVEIAIEQDEAAGMAYLKIAQTA